MLTRSRGAVVEPASVVVTSGVGQGLVLVAGALHGLGRTTVAVEELERLEAAEAGDGAEEEED